MLRRSFLAGLGSVAVGLLFRRKLDGVLASLESEAAEEAAIAAKQVPAAAEITVMPQSTFRPERLFIAAGVSWIVEDITIGKQSQFVQDGGGGIPGSMFAANAVDTALMLDAAGPGTEIKFRVRYVGDNPEGEPFYAGMIGTGIDKDGRQSRMVLPINSGGVRIVS
jgi:hypothetical protein